MRFGRLEGDVRVFSFEQAVARRLNVVAACGLALALAGCSPTMQPRAELTPQPVQPTNAAPTGDTIGTGPVRIALIAPITQGAGQSVVGASLRNAAELAVAESGSNEVTFLVKDDQSTPDGARAAAQQALSEGAELIVGPLFAGGVKEAGRLAKAANKPLIGFSTDASAATRGVYLLSFLIETYVDRIVAFAASKGKKSIAALAPESDYGNVALAEFQSYAASKGVRVAMIERYNSGTLAAAAGRIAAGSSTIDALFVPEQPDGMPAVAQALGAARIDTKRVQVLGTGVWNDVRVLKLPALQGAWFSTPEAGGFAVFAQRYRAKFNADPARIATLGYDAASLVAALARTQGSQRFAESVLTSASGFNGADGIFRFRADGLNDRGLAVMQVSNGAASVISPAPRSFGAGGGA